MTSILPYKLYDSIPIFYHVIIEVAGVVQAGEISNQIGATFGEVKPESSHATPFLVFAISPKKALMSGPTSTLGWKLTL